MTKPERTKLYARSHIEPPVEVSYQDLQDEYDRRGFIYIYINRGDWMGSIAKFFLDEPGPHAQKWKIDDPFSGGRGSYPISANGTAKWEDRRNTKKIFLPTEADWLRDYQGPTRWCKVDKKKIAERANAKPRYDIDGKELAVGDRVLYINTRYGGGSQLDRGTIKEFKANQAGQQFTICLNEDGKEESKISSAECYVYKLPQETSKITTVAAGEWFPFDTAPLDGTYIDLWCGVEAAEEKDPFRFTDCYCIDGTWFMEELDDEVNLTPWIANVTHWTPCLFGPLIYQDDNEIS